MWMPCRKALRRDKETYQTSGPHKLRPRLRLEILCSLQKTGGIRVDTHLCVSRERLMYHMCLLQALR